MADLIKLTNLLDEAKCYEVIRQLRWPNGVVCLHCSGRGVVRNGHDDRASSRQRYLCNTCKCRFDDLTGTVLAGHHQPVSTWILGSYFMGVNLSNRQIAHELGLCESDVQAMTGVLRHGIVAKAPDVVLSGDVEFDELYVVAGHKGNPEAVRAKGPAQQTEGRPWARHLGEGKAADLRHDRARRPSGDPDACQCPASDHPSDHREAKGSNVYTDEYSIYARLPGLGYSHKTVCHGRGEYARDDDGDGFCEVHVNTFEVRRCGAD
jgi:transposase-like protein